MIIGSLTSRLILPLVASRSSFLSELVSLSLSHFHRCNVLLKDYISEKLWYLPSTELDQFVGK